MISNNRRIVNGSLLRRFLHEKVQIMVNIEDIESSGRVLKGKTTDGQLIQIGLSEAITSPVNGWIEVIGVAASTERVNCEEMILFEQMDSDEIFDTENHNMLVTFLNNCEDAFKSA